MTLAQQLQSLGTQSRQWSGHIPRSRILVVDVLVLSHTYFKLCFLLLSGCKNCRSHILDCELFLKSIVGLDVDNFYCQLINLIIRIKNQGPVALSMIKEKKNPKTSLFPYFPNELFIAMTILYDENLHCCTLREKELKIFRWLVVFYRVKP